MPYMTAIYGAEKSSKGGVLHVTPKVIESIKLLIASGANVNARDEHGNTPLHGASSSFRGFTDLPEIIRILIAAGADVNAKTKGGLTPLWYAAHANYSAAKVEAVLRYYGGVGEYK